jgi:hypothetical protein
MMIFISTLLTVHPSPQFSEWMAPFTSMAAQSNQPTQQLPSPHLFLLLGLLLKENTLSASKLLPPPA